jgi:hypothetical protein
VTRTSSHRQCSVASSTFDILQRAQNYQGCSIFWVHDIATMIQWIQSPK